MFVSLITDNDATMIEAVVRSADCNKDLAETYHQPFTNTVSPNHMIAVHDSTSTTVTLFLSSRIRYKETGQEIKPVNSVCAFKVSVNKDNKISHKELLLTEFTEASQTKVYSPKTAHEDDFIAYVFFGDN